MPIAFHPRGRIDERNRPGSAYYAALYEDEPLEPGIFTEGTMPGRGILSYPDAFGDAPGDVPPPRNPIYVSNLGTDAQPFIDRRRIRFSDVDPGPTPNIAETLGPSSVTDAMTRQSGILSYSGQFNDLVDPNDEPPSFIFLPDFDADAPAFTKLNSSKYSDIDPDPVPASTIVPKASEVLSSRARTEAPKFSSAVLSDQVLSNGAIGRQPTVLRPILVTDKDAEEPAFKDESGAGSSNAKLDDGRIPGAVPGTAESLSPNVLTAPSLLGQLSYLRPIGTAVRSNAKRPDVPTPPKKSTFGRAGFAESFIPFWGPGRDLIADIEERDYLGAAMNAGLLAADVFTFAVPPVNVALKAARVGAKAGGLMGGLKGAWEGSAYALRGPILREYASHAEWPHVRKMMGKYGWLEPGQHGHHWLFPQRWKWVPAWIRNHPLNIKGMPTPTHNYRIEQAYDGMPRFTPTQRIWHGMPGWAKVYSAGAAVGRTSKAGYYSDRGHYGRRKNDRPAPAVSRSGADPRTATR